MTWSRSPLFALGLVLVLLGAGIGAGIAIDRLWLLTDHKSDAASEPPGEFGPRRRRHGPPRPERLLERFRARLELSDQQAEIILGILRDVHQEMRAHHKQTRSTRKTLRERGQQRILDVLTEDQASEYRKLVKDQEKRMRNRKRKRKWGPEWGEREHRVPETRPARGQ